MKRYFILAVLLFSLVACTEHPLAETQPVENSNIVRLTGDQLKNISIDTAFVMQEEKTLTLVGKVSFDESKVEKVYPLVGGNALRVNVALGDYVRKGQLLAVIRSAEISDLQSQYTIAQNALNVASKNLEIAESLYNSHTYSELQVISARHDYTAANSEVQRLSHALAVYGASPDSNDAMYNIVSPIDGYVVEKNVNEGEEIRPDNSASVFTVSALNTVWVLADVYENDLAVVSEGLQVDIKTIAYPDMIFSGTIRHIDNVLDPDTKVAHARIELDNSKGLLRPEMFAEVKVHVSLPTSNVTVSSSSVVFVNGNNYVMVRKSNDTFERRLVKTGSTNSKGRTYILEGLQPKEMVVATGSVYVANVE
jgi:cobalt-zinc-cadmium efflux system membrane fusion protein